MPKMAEVKMQTDGWTAYQLYTVARLRGYSFCKYVRIYGFCRNEILHVDNKLLRVTQTVLINTNKSSFHVMNVHGQLFLVY